MRHEFRRIGDARQGVLCETSRAVTPFGGMAVLIELFGRMGLLEAVRERLPFTYRSNHSSRPEHILLAFWLGVVAGARGFAHMQMRVLPLAQVPQQKALPSSGRANNWVQGLDLNQRSR